MHLPHFYDLVDLHPRRCDLGWMGEYRCREKTLRYSSVLEHQSLVERRLARILRADFWPTVGCVLSLAIIMLLAWTMIGIRIESERGFWIGFFLAGSTFLMICTFALAGITPHLTLPRSISEPASAFIVWGGCVVFGTTVSIVGGNVGKQIYIRFVKNFATEQCVDTNPTIFD